MGQTEKAQLSAPTHQARQHHADHLDGYTGPIGGGRRQSDEDHAEGGGSDEEEDADGVGHFVDEVGDEELGDERGNNVCEQDDAFGDCWADQIQSTG